MADKIMIIVVEQRVEIAAKVQDLLTKYGCIIHARLGLHESTKGCVNEGLILLKIQGTDEEIQKLYDEMQEIEGVGVTKTALPQVSQ